MPDEGVFGQRALAVLIRVHDTSPVGERPGLGSADGRYRAERMPGDGWFAQKRGKVIAGRRNVRPACRARSRTLRRASPQTGCWRQLYRGEERWNALVRVERCSRLWMLAPGAPGRRLTCLRAPLRAGHRLAAGKRNDERAPRAARSLLSTQSRNGKVTKFFSRQKLLHWYKYNQQVFTVSSAEKHDVIRVWSPSGLLFFTRALGLAAAKTLPAML